MSKEKWGLIDKHSDWEFGDWVEALVEMTKHRDEWRAYAEFHDDDVWASGPPADRLEWEGEILNRNRELHHANQLIKASHDKVMADNEKLRAELEGAYKMGESLLKRVDHWIEQEMVARGDRDAWKELCGQWMRWALKCEEYASSTYCVEYPPEKPEGVR